VREADLLAATGQSAAAADLYSRVIREAPDESKAYFGLAEVWRSLERFDDAIDVWRRAFHAAGNASLDDAFAVARGEKGLRDLAHGMAELELAGLEAGAESGAYVSSADLARVHARLGRYEQSFKFLDAAFEEHAPGLVFLKVDTAWDGMRGDPRFAAYLRRMKLV
jgi:tetratricopeptide (TPR) repeat protein